MTPLLTIKICVVYSLFALLCGGCATITGQTSYDICIESSVTGTNVEITEHGKFVESVVTPVTVNLKSYGEWHWLTGRPPAMYVFKFTKEGFEPKIEYRNGEVNWWWPFSGGIIGLCMGAECYKLDDARIYVEMRKLTSGENHPDNDKQESAWKLADSGKMENSPSKHDVVQTDEKVKQTSYRIISCEREVGKDFSYRFALEIKGDYDDPLRLFRSIQQKFRAAIKEDYAESFPSVKTDTLFVEFPEYKQDNDRIEGRAVVLTIAVTSLSYDPNTRMGKLAVTVNANQYEEARKWIRKNIETLARDKNVALTTGEIPPSAKFYLGREELKDGNVLEIEFKTE